MNYLSLFSGIAGLDLGLERAGLTCVGQVEQDPFCRQVLETHYPGVPKHDDVRTAVEWWRSAVRPPVHVVAGGPPCQPFSGAGRQHGVVDERWAWPWMCDVVRALRPRYVIVENVRGLVRDAEAFGWILGDLSELGFDAEWTVLSACSLAASHPRERVLLVAHPRSEGLQGLHDTGGHLDLQPVEGVVRRGWPAEPEVARVAYGVPRWMVRDEIQALGNAVVPAVGEFVGRLVLAAHSREAA